MNYVRHGLSVGIERVNSMFYLSIKIEGELTHEDYEVMVPMIENAMLGLKEPRIKAYIDITALEGWTLHAMWDDLTFGLAHGNQFEKIAVVGNKNWQEIASKVGSWFINGEIKSFNNSDEALHWLTS